MVPAGPGAKKKLFPRAPLRLSSYHPSRIEAAMKLDGATEAEIEQRVTGVLGAAVNAAREILGDRKPTTYIAEPEIKPTEKPQEPQAPEGEPTDA